MNLLLDGVVLRAPGALGRVTLDLGPGSHALVVEERTQALELGRLVSGFERPKRGRVLLAGAAPYGSPALRARIGATFGADFAGALDLSVKHAWERVRALRHAHGAAMSEPLGVLAEARLDAPLGELSPAELAQFELELALGVDKPELVWLCEVPPLGEAGTERVLARLRQRADEGAIVVSTVRTAREARLLGDEQHLRAPRASRPEETTHLQLVVERPREIAVELQADPAIHSTSLDPARPNLLFVSGTDDVAVRRACARAVVARQCELTEMVSVPPRVAAAGAGREAAGALGGRS